MKRSVEEALREIKDRISYFCAHTDGKWDPPWAQEIYEIAAEALDEPRKYNEKTI